jgi:hypothetical protein
VLEKISEGVRKFFFFEKKKQKTFVLLATAFPERLSLESQKFWFLFKKKEPLPCCFAGDGFATPVDMISRGD